MMNAQAVRVQPTREQLCEALRVSGCEIDLDEAMRSPALSLALTNTAVAIEASRRAALRASLLRYAPRRDIPKITAGDID